MVVLVAVLTLLPSARAESIVAPIQVSVPSTTRDLVGSANSQSRSYFAFTAVAGTSYQLASQRVDPTTGEIYGPASFVINVYTNDASRTLVATGSTSNLSPWTTPPLQNGSYLVEVVDGLVGYANLTDYYFSISVVATGGTPVGPVPGGPTLAIASLTPSASSVRGGRSVTITVMLSAAAPSGGTVVTLSSSSRVVGVPASVTVPAGATSVTFTATTTTVTKNTSATVTAKTGSSTASTSITVTK
jgi:hypothetical protein